MIYLSQFLAMWLTQLLLSLAGDVESNPGMSQVCKTGAIIVHAPNDNTIPTQTTLSHTQATTHNKQNRQKHMYTTSQQ